MNVRTRGWLVLLAGFALVWTVLHLLAAPTPTLPRGLLVLAGVFAVAAVVQLVLHRVPARDVVRSLGWGRPAPASLVVAVVVAALCLLVFPVFTWVTGHAVSLRAGWPLLSMPFIAATHIPIFFTSGPIVGAGAVLVAAVTALPLAYLYERGNATIWAPAIVHAAIDTFKIVEIPGAGIQTFSLMLVAVSLAVPLLAIPLTRLADAAVSR